uniref:Uncharacterized protein n=1 Tax=Glossina austeni TaxID=7395 RepID=A0A1A9VE36_GLOAU
MKNNINEKRLQRLNDRQNVFNAKYKKTIEQQEKQQQQYKENSNNNIISSSNNNEFNTIMDVSRNAHTHIYVHMQ